MPFFGLSALSSITALISGSVTDEFKKFIQPRALVAAAVFLVLNLIFVFLPLVNARVAFAIRLAGIPPIWQLALLTLALPILGYLISSLGAIFLNAVNGRALRDTWLGELLQERQRVSFKRLKRKVRKGSQSSRSEAIRAANRLALDFPHEYDAIVSTALGNVLLSTSSYTLNQYGARLDTLYPIISSQLEENDILQKRIIDSQESLTFFATLANLLVVVALEVLILTIGLREASRAWPVLPALVTAYVAYRAGVQTAYAWSQNMRVLFDVYLEQAATALNLGSLPAEKVNEHKQRWAEVSRWLTYGMLRIENPRYARPKQRAKWYRTIQPVTPAPSQPQAVHPSSVIVEIRSRGVARPDPSETPSRKVFGLLVYDYVFAIFNAQEHPTSNCYLVVEDTRLSALPTTISGTLRSIANSNAPSQARPIMGRRCVGNALLWLPGNIAAYSGAVLEYSVRHDEIIVTVEPDCYIIKTLSAPDSSNMQVVIQSNLAAPQPLTITVTTSYNTRQPAHKAFLEASFSIEGYAKGSEPERAVLVPSDPRRPDRRQWKIDPKQVGEITFGFTRRTK